MKGLTRRLLSIVICVIYLFCTYVPANAQDDPTIISFKVGSDKIEVNGKAIPSAKSYREGNHTVVPLRLILESFGAEVNWKSNGSINLVYKNTVIDLFIGQKNCLVNGIEEELPAAPVIKKGVTMVPVRFISESFGAAVAYDSKKDSVRITVEDSSLKDFSLLTGGINKGRIGNSYFGWSISLPRGSSIAQSSFNGKSVLVVNTSKKMLLHIQVNSNSRKEPKEYIEIINKDLEKKGIKATINTAAGKDYAELSCSIEDGAELKRIYTNESFMYSLSFFIEDGKESELNNFKSVIDSFKLGYKGSSTDIKDISKSKNGFISYKDKESLYSIDILPEWDILSPMSNPDDIWDSMERTDMSREGLFVDVEPMEDGSSMESYMQKKKQQCLTGFKTGLFNFMEEKSIDLKSKKAYKLLYSLQSGKNRYIIEENYIREGNLVYVIHIKTYENRYASQRERMDQVLKSFSLDLKKHVEIEKSFSSKDESQPEEYFKVGNSDALKSIASKEYKWKMSIPGYWFTSADPENYENDAMFVNNRSKSIIGVRSIKKDNKSDEEKFSFKTSRDGDMSYTGKQLLNKGNKQVRAYSFRIESELRDAYIDVKLYVVDGNNYTYGFFTMIPDIFASDKNIKEITDIWESFGIED